MHICLFTQALLNMLFQSSLYIYRSTDSWHLYHRMYKQYDQYFPQKYGLLSLWIMKWRLLFLWKNIWHYFFYEFMKAPPLAPPLNSGSSLSPYFCHPGLRDLRPIFGTVTESFFSVGLGPPASFTSSDLLLIMKSQVARYFYSVPF